MKFISSVAIFIISTIAINLHAAPHCGEITRKRFSAPYDYIDPDQKPYLELVESAHFTPNIETLRHGNSGTLGGELSYTLIQFPNHHRALAAFSKLSLRDKTLKPAGAHYTVWCFFDRAIRFKPNDALVRMLLGNYLLKAGQADKATEQLQIAVDLQPEDPTINYNLGLLYMQKKNYEQAKIYAKKAYELGFPLPGLKNQLVKAGKWDGD